MKKANDKSKENNKPKLESNSFSSANKRSHKFDSLLNQSSRPNTTNFKSISPRERFKKIWKWISIVIYLFLAGLGITGFIQSCVLRTSSTVGAGVELYNSKDDIAPHVNTYQLVKTQKTSYIYDQNGKIKIDANGNYETRDEDIYQLVKVENANYLTPREDIVAIKKQLLTDYNQDVANLYGAYNNYSSTIRIIDQDGNDITNIANNSQSLNAKGLIQGDNGYIFINDKILQYLNQEGLGYQYKNVLQDICLFTVARPDNFDSLSNEEKDLYGLGSTSINNAFDAYEIINNQPYKVEVVGGQYVTKDVNGDGIIDSDTYVQITDLERINNFKYALNAEVATLSKDAVGLFNSEKFARDYYQTMNNLILKNPQMFSFYNKVLSGSINSNSSVQDIYKVITKSNLQGLTQKYRINNNGIDQRAIDANSLFTIEQKNAILTYQNEMVSLMTQLGFGVKKQVYSDETSDYYPSTPNQEFEIVFQPQINDKRNIVLGTGSAAQKPIFSWGGAWGLGPFYGLIVWPLSFVINGMTTGLGPLNGWGGVIAIVVAILLTRIIVTLFTYKTLFSSHKQQQLNPKKAKIDAKYAPFKGNREMEQRKRQEIAKLYKSNNVSMVDPLKALCISMPIFFAVWRVVQGIPDIKSTTWLGIQFSLTSWKELLNGSWQYLPLLLMAAATQALSHYLPRLLNRKRMSERSNKAEQQALKQANKTQNIIMIVFIIISILFEAGVQIYWIVGGLWQIMQVLIVHHIVKGKWYRTKGYKYL